MRVGPFLASLFLFGAVCRGEAPPLPHLDLDLGAGTVLPVVLIPAGTFTQGSPVDETGRGEDEPMREVSLSRPYYLGKTAVTVSQWKRFVSETGYRTEAETGPSGGFGWQDGALVQKKGFDWKNPGFPQTDAHPVPLVTAPDARAFCRWLEQKINRSVSLPTEAQWEYACRAGTKTPWHSPSGPDALAWHKGNSGNQTHPAASTQANAWGLHMGGSVAEWCEDWYGPYPDGPVTDPLQSNPRLSSPSRRVLRGGSWNRDPKNTRSAARFRSDERSRNADIGFRILCAVEETPAGTAGTPAPLMPHAPSHRAPTTVPLDPPDESSGGTLSDALFGMACMACPLVVLVSAVLIVVRAFRRKGKGPHPPGRTGAAALAQKLGKTSSSPTRTQIRIVEDGFWMLMDLAPGTTVHYVYRPHGGMDVNGQTSYQPGPQGQFVFTGARPQNVRVTGAGNHSLDHSFTDNPASPPSLPLQDSPPRYPSAY